MILRPTSMSLAMVLAASKSRGSIAGSVCKLIETKEKTYYVPHMGKSPRPRVKK